MLCNVVQIIFNVPKYFAVLQGMQFCAISSSLSQILFNLHLLFIGFLLHAILQNLRA